LKSNQQTIYINFSSGAIYRDFSKPAFFDSKSSITINHIDSKDFYSIAKINSEAKHRSNNSLTIFDIRVFSYFSKFIDLEGPSFITEIICCLKNNKPFITNSNDMLRDYSGSDDLFQLVKKCSEHSGVNSGFDLYTTNPVSKFEIIDFFSKNYSLKWEIEKSIIPATLTGYKNQYFSENRKAEELGFKPVCSSIEVIRNVSKQILGR